MQVPVFEAKNRFSALVAEAERGHEVTITRRGVAVARIVPVGPVFDRERARRAADGLLRVSQGARLDGLSIRALIEEGRS